MTKLITQIIKQTKWLSQHTYESDIGYLYKYASKWKLKGTYQFLVYVVDINLLGTNILS
jgi:hypothetical protein